MTKHLWTDNFICQSEHHLLRLSRPCCILLESDALPSSSVKSWDKNHERWLLLVKYCDLLDWIRAKWLGIDKKIVPVSEKLRRDPWGFQQQGWSVPQRSISMTVTGDCSTSHLRQRPAYGTGQQRSKRWSTSQHLADGGSRLKTKVFEDVSAQLLAFARLQSLV